GRGAGGGLGRRRDPRGDRRPRDRDPRPGRRRRRDGGRRRGADLRRRPAPSHRRRRPRAGRARLLRAAAGPALRRALCRDQPGSAGFFRGTSTSRLNSATMTPSWFNTRVWTLTVPRSGFERDSLTSSTSVSQKSVSPWKTGFGWLSSSVARFAIALPETSET